MTPTAANLTDRAPSRAAVWLCVVVLVAVGFLEPVVLCHAEEGPPHLEFVHLIDDDGGCPGHDHHHAAPVDHSYDDHDGGTAATDPSHEHESLAIDLAPAPQPDASAPADDAPAIGAPAIAALAPRVGDEAVQRPPATGPPRQATYLRHRRTTVLQL